jgi:hypothetical protein
MKTVLEAVNVYDHISKVELVKGDLCETAPTYVADNPRLVVSLLYLDLDLLRTDQEGLGGFSAANAERGCHCI